MSNDLLNAPPPPPLVRRHSPVGVVSAAVLVAGSGAVHLAVVPGHLREYVPFGVFFLVVRLGQLVGRSPCSYTRTVGC